MKITNATSKKITLVNGKVINPNQTIEIVLVKDTPLYDQVHNLNKKGLLDFN